MKGNSGGSEISFSGGGRRDTCLAKIQKLEKDRANRRNKIEKARADRVVEEARNIANGNPGDVDFMGMIRAFRNERAGTALPHVPSKNGMKICIAIRKRPTNSKEKARKDHDAVSCFNPEVTVHDCKLKVDGISKYLDSVGFRFDHAFGEDVNNQLVYNCTAKPLVPFVLNRGRATVFAYGQTGSGKTYTMVGIQASGLEESTYDAEGGEDPLCLNLKRNATNDLFEQLAEMPGGDSFCVFVSFFEIYGGHCQDLLNHRNRVVVREDGKGEVVIAGLEEKEAMDAEELEELIADGNRNRTTHATESNDQSSRSHAICQISIRNISTGRLHGKLSLIDLAGSERGADTKSHDRQRRMEGADINKSLLALKECIRALDSESVHVPYRASKLTLVLKDSFTRKGARTVMIATVSPGASSADHTINTLRYADRVKENKVEQFRPGANGGSPAVAPPAAAVASGYALPQDQPPPPPSPPSPPSSNRASAAASDNGGLRGEGVSSLQRRQFDHRRGGGTSPRTSVTVRAGAAEAASPRGARENLPDRGGLGRFGSRGPSVNERAEGRMEVDSGMGRRRLHASPSPERAGSDKASTTSTISYMHNRSGRQHHPEENDEERFGELHHMVQSLFQEEETLLNMHMDTVKENAELLTEEGLLLQSMQGNDLSDYVIDNYANRLSEIIDRKMTLQSTLQFHLRNFVNHRGDPNYVPQY